MTSRSHLAYLECRDHPLYEIGTVLLYHLRQAKHASRLLNLRNSPEFAEDPFRPVGPEPIAESEGDEALVGRPGA
jgi:hypothetical protein